MFIVMCMSNDSQPQLQQPTTSSCRHSDALRTHTITIFHHWTPLTRPEIRTKIILVIFCLRTETVLIMCYHFINDPHTLC